MFLSTKLRARRFFLQATNWLLASILCVVFPEALLVFAVGAVVFSAFFWAVNTNNSILKTDKKRGEEWGTPVTSDQMLNFESSVLSDAFKKQYSSLDQDTQICLIQLFSSKPQNQSDKNFLAALFTIDSINLIRKVANLQLEMSFNELLDHFTNSDSVSLSLNKNPIIDLVPNKNQINDKAPIQVRHFSPALPVPKPKTGLLS